LKLFRNKLVLSTLIISWLSIGINAQTTSKLPADDPGMSTSLARLEDRAVLRAHKKELDRLALFYNYDLNNVAWESKVLQCPCFSKNLFFDFETVEFFDGRSHFIAVISPQNGAIKIIPLAYYGLRTFDAPYRDPHNWALFNEIMESEAPVVKTKDQWLKIASCFLGIVGESTNIITSSKFVKTLGNANDPAISRVLPNVKFGEKTIEITFVTIENLDLKTFSSWELKYNPKGFLLVAYQEERTLSDLFNMEE
jgi:hypothetical protein